MSTAETLRKKNTLLSLLVISEVNYINKIPKSLCARTPKVKKLYLKPVFTTSSDGKGFCKKQALQVLDFDRASLGIALCCFFCNSSFV